MEHNAEVKEETREMDIKTSYYLRVAILVGAFVLLNSLKLTLFNYVIMPSKTFEALMYKGTYTLLVSVIIFYLFFKIKYRFPFIIFYVIQAAYIFAYLSYYTYFRSYLHLFQVTALYTEGVGPIKHFYLPVDWSMLILLIDIPVFVGLIFQYSKVNAFMRTIKQHARRILILSILLIVSIESWNLLQGYSIVQFNKDFFTHEPKIIERYGTFVNNISDVAVNYGGENMIKHFDYGKTISSSSEEAKKPNIVVIQVESMDSSLVGQQYKGKYITPYLNQLTKESIYYPYALSYHKAGGTSDCEFSVINSIEPLGNYPSMKIAKYDYPNSFVKSLTKEGYRAMAYHGNIGNFYNRDVAFPKMGFDKFIDTGKMNLEEVGWGAPDADVFDYAFNDIENDGSPFFSYIITMTSHAPFTSVDHYYDDNTYNPIKEDIVKGYFKSMAYVDASIKKFVQDVQRKFPNTFVFIFGDHTPNIDNSIYKQTSLMSGDSYFEFVPLFILTPDKKVYHETKEAASFLDIAPTIMYASGIQFTIKSDGIDLINPPSEKSKIPFKGRDYTRSELFQMAIQDE